MTKLGIQGKVMLPTTIIFTKEIIIPTMRTFLVNLEDSGRADKIWEVSMTFLNSFLGEDSIQSKLKIKEETSNQALLI